MNRDRRPQLLICQYFGVRTKAQIHAHWQYGALTQADTYLSSAPQGLSVKVLLETQ